MLIVLTSSTVRLDSHAAARVVISVPGLDPRGLLQVFSQKLHVGDTHISQKTIVARSTGLLCNLVVQGGAESYPRHEKRISPKENIRKPSYTFKNESARPLNLPK